MSKQWLTIEFNELDNDAFSGEDVGPELARILRDLARRFEVMSRDEFVNDDADCKLKDINGNTIGSVSGVFHDDEADEQKLYDAVRRHIKWMSVHEIARFLEDFCGASVLANATEGQMVDDIVQAIKAEDVTIDDLEGYSQHT